jgi:hypothetical protein
LEICQLSSPFFFPSFILLCLTSSTTSFSIAFCHMIHKYIKSHHMKLWVVWNWVWTYKYAHSTLRRISWLCWWGNNLDVVDCGRNQSVGWFPLTSLRDKTW